MKKLRSCSLRSYHLSHFLSSGSDAKECYQARTDGELFLKSSLDKLDSHIIYIYNA